MRLSGMTLPPVRLRSLVSAGLTVPVLAACASTPVGGEGGAASCAAVIEYHGAAYWGQGGVKRDPPTTGREVRGLLPGCDDTGGQQPAEPDATVRVAELVDVPLETAFLWDNAVFVREGARLPPTTRIWFRAPRCTSPGTFRLAADWLGVTSPHRARFDGDLRPPYRLQVHVTDGPTRYVGATVTVRADASTRPRLGREDVKASLWRGGRVVARVACESGGFRALSLQVP